MLDEGCSHAFSDTTPLETRGGPLPTFEDAYFGYRGFVERVAKRSGIPDSQLDDICQEVFIVVHRKLPSFEGRARLSTWIYCIVRNVVSNNKRSRSKRPLQGYRDELRVELEELLEDPTNAEDALVRRELIAYACRRLMTLSKKKRTAFLLNDLEGYTIDETAQMTKTCPHTIRSRVRSVRRDMKLVSARFQ
jgi:RNA polymerase sigma-70 factor, ECF subfamily